MSTKKSIEEKKLDGTYRPDRDKPDAPEVVILKQKMDGLKVLSIEPPDEIKNDAYLIEAWEWTVNPICGLGIIYKQDIQSLYHLSFLLKEISRIKNEISKISVKNKNYKTLNQLLVSNIKEYSNLAGHFLVTPMARMKASSFALHNEEKKKDELEEFRDS